MQSFKDKGHHEKAMEKAKDLIDKGVGMSEIKEITGLNENDVTKARMKMKGKI